MGEQKLLLPYKSKTVIEQVVDEIRASVSGVTVVTGYDHERIVSRLGDRHLTFLRNTDFTQGMITSVRCGLSTMPDDVTGCLLALGDQPGVTASVINRLIKHFDADNAGIVYPLYNEQKGHPLIFSHRYFSEIREHYNDVGLRRLLQAHPNACHPVPVDDIRVLKDIDTPEDYQRETMRLSHR